MKKINFVIAILLAGMFSCSKNSSNNPAPALQNAKVAVVTIQPPAALNTYAQSNTYAATVVGYVQAANGIATFTSMLAVPPGGTNSAKIQASNARVAATASTTQTWVYTNTQTGESAGYQVTDEGTSYLWEYFYRASSTANWLKAINATEAKDGSTGDLKAYDYQGTNPSFVTAEYNWVKTANLYTFTYTDNSGGDYFVITMNNDTSGTISGYNGVGTNAVLSYKYTWGADGRGTWTIYGSDGITVSSNGTW
ncbi:MAG: hypothetical protein JST43_04755 [Bacteroidetes bacterium]|nr:hypothetical protein [Bacteroidota bacterium]MBS1539866.1 hypothetical protein [Bacteroidota bacterium]